MCVRMCTENTECASLSLSNITDAHKGERGSSHTAHLRGSCALTTFTLDKMIYKTFIAVVASLGPNDPTKLRPVTHFDHASYERRLSKQLRNGASHRAVVQAAIAMGAPPVVIVRLVTQTCGYAFSKSVLAKVEAGPDTFETRNELRKFLLENVPCGLFLKPAPGMPDYASCKGCPCGYRVLVTGPARTAETAHTTCASLAASVSSSSSTTAPPTTFSGTEAEELVVAA